MNIRYKFDVETGKVKEEAFDTPLFIDYDFRKI